MAKISDLESRELYFFGLGSGGEFVQRFVMNCPKNIARAVGSGVEYSSLSSSDVFPNSFEKTPLLPNSEFNILDFVKSEFLFLIPKDIDREQEKFFKELSLFSEKRGIRSRNSIKHIGSASLQGTIKAGMKYLLEGN